MKIHAPDPKFDGSSRYGDLELKFKDGVATHDGDLPHAVRAYMVSAGYGIDRKAPKREAAPGPQAHDAVTRIGTPLADASTGKQPDESGQGGETPPEPFDPGQHNVNDVLEYVGGIDDSDPEAHDAEVARIVEAEKAGKNRSTLLEAIEGSPAGD